MNWNAGGSLTIGLVGPSSLSLSVGSGRERADSLWVSEQTAIIAEDRLFAGVGGHTQIDGALIAARSGALLIDTRTLGFSDIEERIVERVQDVQLGVNLGWGGDQTGTERPGQGLPGATLSGQLASRDVERVTRATVGPGQIVVRDEEAQTQDLAALNRDLDRAQEVIRDEAAGVRFYASDTAIRELASGFATTRANLEANRALFEYGLSGLTEEIARSVAEAAAMLGLQGLSVEEAQQAIVAAQVASGAISAEEAAQIAAILELLATNDPATAYASLSAGIVDGVPVSPETIARALATARTAALAYGGAAIAGALTAVGVGLAAFLYSTEVGGRIDQTETLSDGSTLRIVGGGSEAQLSLVVSGPSGERTMVVLSRVAGGVFELVYAEARTSRGQAIELDARTVLGEAGALLGAAGGGFTINEEGALVLTTPPTRAGGPQTMITIAAPLEGVRQVWTPIQVDNGGDRHVTWVPQGQLETIFRSSPLDADLIGRFIDGSNSLDPADRGGQLTLAGRALQKHGGRSESAFPPATGNPSSINSQGQRIVEEILRDPGSRSTHTITPRYGPVIDVRAPDGRGLRYAPDGRLIGFLEP